MMAAADSANAALYKHELKPVTGVVFCAKSIDVCHKLLGPLQLQESQRL